MQLLWLMLFNDLALNKDLILISYMASRAPSSELLVLFYVAQHLNPFPGFLDCPQTYQALSYLSNFLFML